MLRNRRSLGGACVLALVLATSIACSVTANGAPVERNGARAAAGGSHPRAGGSVNSPHPASQGGGTCPASSPPGPLSTSGTWIVDNQGNHIRLAGVTWDAMQTVDFVPSGLEYQSYQKILCTIKTMGFNTVRIPLSDQLVRDNSSITIANDVNFTINPSLSGGLHPLDVLDRIVAAAQRIGLMIILDNHFSAARQCPAAHNCPGNVDSAATVPPSTDEYPWLDSGYTESQWIDDWSTLALRYGPGGECGQVPCGPQATVIGFDLRNEPHTNYGHHPWSLNDYLTRGATWGPYPNAQSPDPRWNPNSDWAAAATAAGDKILTENPHLLMFVEGVQLYPDKTQRRGVEVYTDGGILRGAQTDPIRFTVNGQLLPHQLVYSTHEWGPIKDNLLGEFSYRTTFKTMRAIFWQNWAFILHESADMQAPIWLGEFNSCNTSSACLSSKKHGSQGQWFQIMLQFLRIHKQIGWSYYPVNGTNWLNQPESNGVLKRGWAAVKMPALITALQTVQKRWPLNVTASSAIVTFGQPIPAISASYTGFKYDQISPQTPPACGTTAVPGADAGTYSTSCSGAADAGYSMKYVNGTVTIEPAGSMTTLSSHLMRKPTTYGQPVSLHARVTSTVGTPAGAVLFVDGRRNLGQAGIKGGKAVLSTTAIGAGKRRLTATYIPSTNSKGATNYSQSASPSVAHSVLRAALTVRPLDTTVSFGHLLPALQWSADFMNDDTGASLRKQPLCSAKVNLDATNHVTSSSGVYKIWCRGASDPNYLISYGKGKLRVRPAKVTISYLGAKRLKLGKQARLSASLTDSSGKGIGGRYIRLTVAEPGYKQSCRTGKTGRKGVAFCSLPSVTLPPGNATVVMRFVGDAPPGPVDFAAGSSHRAIAIIR